MPTHEQLHLPLKFRRLVQCSAARPDNPDHHLRRWRGRPYWVKIRIDQGPKFVGKDAYIPLRTKDVELARRIRDGILHGLHAGGFINCRVIESSIPEEG